MCFYCFFGVIPVIFPYLSIISNPCSKRRTRTRHQKKMRRKNDATKLLLLDAFVFNMLILESVFLLPFYFLKKHGKSR